MTGWFGILPQADCDVEAATSGAVAYYFSPALDGSRGGTFFMNTSEPTGWGRYQIESTAYHEGIPGHHLQLAIAGELTTIPEFRKRAFIAAYSEGWGLYAERLADEMGLYTTPLDRMGMLSADSMRACRLGCRHRACMPSAGAAARRSTTCSRTRRCARATSAPRSTATWSCPARPSAT